MFSKKNKKAQIGETMALIVATIIIVLILIIFFFIATFMQKKTIENTEREGIDLVTKEAAMTSLLAYLQTPVNVIINEKNINITMYELIAIWAKDSNSEKQYREKLREETSKIFDGIYECYDFRIPYYKPILTPYYLPDSETEESGDFAVNTFEKHPAILFRNYAEIELPLPNKKLGKIRLRVGCN